MQVIRESGSVNLGDCRSGQPNEGGLTVPQIARQVAAEGAQRVVVVTDEPWKYAKNEEWPRGLTIPTLPKS